MAVVVLDFDGTFACGGLGLVDEVDILCCERTVDEVEACALELVFGVLLHLLHDQLGVVCYLLP